MTTPIHFQGSDYDSVEAMPPDVRAKYEQLREVLGQQHGPEQAGPSMEQLRRSLKDRQSASKAEQPLTPAWGGPRPEGSVPVPVEFDQVAGLGPALEVYPHEGIQILPNFGTPRAHELVRYRDGFAFKAGGKDVYTWRHDEVAVIQSNLTRHLTEHGVGYTQHEYTLIKASGEKLILDDQIKVVGGAAENIKTAVFAHLRSALLDRYKMGEAQTFGPVTVQQSNGLQLSGKPYAWDAIQDIRVESGRFKIVMRDGKKHEVRVSAIPNIELLCQIIGVKLLSPELAYY